MIGSGAPPLPPCRAREGKNEKETTAGRWEGDMGRTKKSTTHQNEKRRKKNKMEKTTTHQTNGRGRNECNGRGGQEIGKTGGGEGAITEGGGGEGKKYHLFGKP